MENVNFRSRTKIVGLTSFVGSTFLIIAITGLILQLKAASLCSILIYFGCKLIVDSIWRCPNCKSKLPKGEHVNNLDECLNCNYDLCN